MITCYRCIVNKRIFFKVECNVDTCPRMNKSMALDYTLANMLLRHEQKIAVDININETINYIEQTNRRLLR